MNELYNVNLVGARGEPTSTVDHCGFSCLQRVSTVRPFSCWLAQDPRVDGKARAAVVKLGNQVQGNDYCAHGVSARHSPFTYDITHVLQRSSYLCKFLHISSYSIRKCGTPYRQHVRGESLIPPCTKAWRKKKTKTMASDRP